MSSNLCSFDDIKKIINRISSKNIVSYDGAIGTSQAVGVSPYQTLELRISFYEEQERPEQDNPGGN